MQRLERLDMRTLTIDNASFIDEGSDPNAADLLVRVMLRASVAELGERRSHASSSLEPFVTTQTPGTFVYILLEHKSYADQNTLLQLLRYMTRIWDRYRKQNPNGLPPPILPIIFFYGSAPWSGPRAFNQSVASHANRIDAALHTVLFAESKAEVLAHLEETR